MSVFVNRCDEFYIDLMFLVDSKYSSKSIPKSTLMIYYESARGRVYIEVVKNKKASCIADTLDGFVGYMNKFKD